MDEIIELHEQIKTLIEEKHYKELKTLLSEVNAVDIAEALGELSESYMRTAFRLLQKDQASDTFVAMEREEQEFLIKSFTDTELVALVKDISVDDTVDIIGEMPANVVARILRSADAQTRKSINEILLYPEHSAGSMMTPGYVALHPGMTVEESFEKIRKVGQDKETIYTCYVTENRRLLGVVSVRSMLIAPKTTKIEELMHENYISVKTTDDKEFVAGQIKKYGYLALPVVDTEEKLVGIVTIDDAIEVIEEEATEDIQKMTAIIPDESPYLRLSIFKIWKQRIPWLILLMILATLTSKIIGMYEAALSACIVLNSFIPMIMGTGGNAGSQSSVTIIRGISLGEIRVRDALRVAWKEIRAAVIIGVTLAPITFVKVMYLDGLYREPDGVIIAVVISITLIVTVIVAKLVGAVLPIFAKIIHLDPAVMASPFITAIVDALSLIVYFAIASSFIPALA
jgi:magnesium transporter